MLKEAIVLDFDCYTKIRFKTTTANKHQDTDQELYSIVYTKYRLGNIK